MIIWIAVQNEDMSCFNLMAKTKKDLIAQIKNHSENYGRLIFHSAHKINVNTSDIFSLIDHLTGEEGTRDQYISNDFITYSIRKNLSFTKLKKGETKNDYKD